MKYRVFGHTSVVVTTVVEFDGDKKPSEEEIYEAAVKNFRGINSYVGNGGIDKLIGVDGDHDSIYSDEMVDWDDYERRPML